LIEELIASHKYKNLVIIQPTLALLDETRKKLKKYAESYKVVVSTLQAPDIVKGNIFLFTGERVVEYGMFKEIDFFIIDEFYKLSLDRDDERAITLNHAFYKLLKYTKSFYMLGPMIKSIPETFKNRFSFLWYHTNYSTVAVDEKSIYKPEFKDKDFKQEELFALLTQLKEPTLIYCSAPERATKITIAFLHYQKKSRIKPENNEHNLDLIDWLKENVHQDWSLIEALRYSIAFHHGALPRHLGSSIVDAFNNGSIKYLFCTATLIEGVNTSAKNIILFDKRKGLKPIDYFDYRNIAGRSGRMKKYFIGNVIKFEEEPTQLELDIDIPILTQKNAPLELLVHLDDKELTDESREKLSILKGKEEGLLKLIKNNSGVSVEGQLKMVDSLENNLRDFHQMIAWTGYPKYNELAPLLRLIWESLISQNENKANIRTPEQLAVIAIQYYNYKSINGIINHSINDIFWIKKIPDSQERIDYISFYILNVVRHWFDYKLPKLLGVASKIQEYVFKKNGLHPGEYSFFANQLENAFLPNNLVMLMEYDIPNSAIRKLFQYVGTIDSPEAILKKITQLDLSKTNLNKYEIRKVRDGL